MREKKKRKNLKHHATKALAESAVRMLTMIMIIPIGPPLLTINVPFSYTCVVLIN